MSGMCRYTGKLISDIDHLKQSIIDILTTPKNSRCMNRSYGCGVFDLVDSNATDVDYYSAIAEALGEYEAERFELERVSCLRNGGGVLNIEVSGVYIPTQQRIGVNVGRPS